MPQNDTINLDAYFQRIGYSGSTSPTLATLQALHFHHALAIPFENFGPLLNQPVLLDPASLECKLIHERRGGYCFEHNLLFGHVLNALGFRFTNLAARVIWNAPEDAITPRSHMLLLVEIDEKLYIADVGFGGLTLTSPLRLEADVEQETPHEPFRLIASGDDFIQQARLGDKWKSLYRFDLQRQYQADYEVSNWYLSHHPQSPFVTGLMAARPRVDRRYAFFNNAVAVHHLNGTTERRQLQTVPEFRAALYECLDLTRPDSADVEDVFQRLITDAKTNGR